MKRTNKLAVVGLAFGLLVAIILAYLLFGGKGPSQTTETPKETETTTTPISTPVPTLNVDDGFISDGGTPSPEMTVPPIEDDFTEEDASHSFDASVKYVNNRVLKWQYNDKGDYISVGVNNPSDDRYLYINPHVSIEENLVHSKGKEVGFYIVSTRCPVFCDAETRFEGEFSEQNEPHSSFLINKAYDELKPAAYNDKNHFGVAWANDVLYDGQLDVGTTLYIRAISLNEGMNLLASVQVDICVDDHGRYYIDDIKDLDAVRTGYLSEEDKAELLDRAYDCVSNVEYGPVSSAAKSLTEANDRQGIIADAFVEYYGDRTYFNNCVSYFGHLITKKQLNYSFHGIYAVTFNVPWSFSNVESGYLTVYYSADADPIAYDALVYDFDPNKINEYNNLLDVSPATSKELCIFGYDQFYPISEDMIGPPKDYFATLY